MKIATYHVSWAATIWKDVVTMRRAMALLIAVVLCFGGVGCVRAEEDWTKVLPDIARAWEKDAQFARNDWQVAYVEALLRVADGCKTIDAQKQGLRATLVDLTGEGVPEMYVAVIENGPSGRILSEALFYFDDGYASCLSLGGAEGEVEGRALDARKGDGFFLLTEPASKKKRVIAKTIDDWQYQSSLGVTDLYASYDYCILQQLASWEVPWDMVGNLSAEERNARLEPHYAEFIQGYTLQALPSLSLFWEYDETSGFHPTLDRTGLHAQLSAYTPPTFTFTLWDDLARAGQTANAQTDYGASTLFTREEIQSAMDVVLRRFVVNYSGCELKRIAYKEKSGASDTNYIVLDTDFNVTELCDDAFEVGMWEGWSFTLQRDGPASPWRITNWGYC